MPSVRIAHLLVYVASAAEFSPCLTHSSRSLYRRFIGMESRQSVTMPANTCDTRPQMEVQTPKGATQHYTVLDMIEESGTGGTTVIVLAGKWLDMGAYAAALEVDGTRTKGSYAVYGGESSLERITFAGTFRPGIPVLRKGFDTWLATSFKWNAKPIYNDSVPGHDTQLYPIQGSKNREKRYAKGHPIYYSGVVYRTSRYIKRRAKVVVASICAWQCR